MSPIFTVGTIIGLVIFYLAVLGLGLASYILSSLALYTMAKRRRISKPWLSWIPVANLWIIGCLTDDYDDLKTGIKRKWRSVLLTLSIIVIGSVIVMYIPILLFALSLDQYYYAISTLFLILSYILTLILMVAAITLEVVTDICLFKIFEWAKPEKAVKYLLLSLLIPLAEAICLMKCKDEIPEDIEFTEDEPIFIETDQTEL